MENNLTYTRNGDYLIPDLSLSEQPEKPLGKYGRMRKAYLKEHRPLIYNQLLLTEISLGANQFEKKLTAVFGTERHFARCTNGKREAVGGFYVLNS